MRITLTAAAFVLWQELQLRADRTALRGAQFLRLRQALITIGVQVVRSVRRIAAPAGFTNHAGQAAAALHCDLTPRQRDSGALAVAETRSFMNSAG